MEKSPLIQWFQEPKPTHQVHFFYTIDLFIVIIKKTPWTRNPRLSISRILKWFVIAKPFQVMGIKKWSLWKRKVVVIWGVSKWWYCVDLGIGFRVLGVFLGWLLIFIWLIILIFIHQHCSLCRTLVIFPWWQNHSMGSCLMLCTLVGHIEYLIFPLEVVTFLSLFHHFIFAKFYFIIVFVFLEIFSICSLRSQVRVHITILHTSISSNLAYEWNIVIIWVSL